MKNTVLQMNDNYQRMVIAYQHKGCALSCLVLPPGAEFSLMVTTPEQGWLTLVQ